MAGPARPPSSPAPARQNYTAETRLWREMTPEERLSLLQKLWTSAWLSAWEQELLAEIQEQVIQRPDPAQTEHQQRVIDRISAQHRVMGARRHA